MTDKPKIRKTTYIMLREKLGREGFGCHEDDQWNERGGILNTAATI